MLDTPRSPKSSLDMKTRQKPLMETYVAHPERAMIVDSAFTSSDITPVEDAIHTHVEFGHANPAHLQMGVHRAVGGDCDFPNPGEMLSAAIASCLDTTIRIIANRMSIPIERLAVTVDASVDVRGTLCVDRAVPVGFQTIKIGVQISSAIPLGDGQLDRLLKAAEASCVVLQTIKNTPNLDISRNNVPV